MRRYTLNSKEKILRGEKTEFPLHILMCGVSALFEYPLFKLCNRVLFLYGED